MNTGSQNKNLQDEGEIRFELDTEAFYVNVVKIPKEVEGLIDEMSVKLNKRHRSQLSKVDVIYSVMSSIATSNFLQSLEMQTQR